MISRLNRGLDRKITLISAQAGAGKTTLMAQWLEECPQPSAWLSLDEYDNDLVVFLGYLCEAIRTVFPDGCEPALDLLNAPQPPPTRIMTASLVNELDSLIGKREASNESGAANVGLILALDDVQKVTSPAIQELLSGLVAYLPQGVHLALTSRTDPNLPLAGLRARREMSELRTQDMRFTADEARVFLELTAGRELSRSAVEILGEKTEGWAVGLRLAALSIRDIPDDRFAADIFKGAGNSLIVDYLLSEVLYRQSRRYQDFLLQTSVLDQLNAELCDAVFRPREHAHSDTPRPSVATTKGLLQELDAANLFLIPLDHAGRTFRYHHLLQDLLRARLERHYSQEEIAALHIRASQWFERNGYVREALSHVMLAGDMDRAVQVFARRRYALMNQARWQELERLLRVFPPIIAERHPELLMLHAWLLYHRGHYDQLPTALASLEAAIDETILSPESIRHLKAEISALRSLLFYYQADPEQTIVEAEYSIRYASPEAWIIRILARLYLAGALLMKGDLNRAYAAYFQGASEESVQGNAFRATMLMAGCNLHWVAADLLGLMQVADQCMKVSDYPYSAEIRGFARYHLGCASYQLNDLAAAEAHFTAVTRQPYLNYGDCFAYGAYGLALTYQAQNRPDDAREVVASALAFTLETGNMTLLPVVRAYQAEIAFRQGQSAAAGQWADQLGTIPPLSPMVQLFRPHLALARIWSAQEKHTRRQQASDLLDQLEQYTESTYNTVCLIEVLAMQAYLRVMENNEPAALKLLERAVVLAQPAGFIRLFVDLGAPIADLLEVLQRQGVAPEYVSRILGAFPQAHRRLKQLPTDGNGLPPSGDVQPLTPREQEVLELLAKRLTNREIAQELIISLGTVKTHTLNIYAKLDVHGRHQAVDRAKELRLLNPI